MILEPCTCSWDIPGVDALPDHNHCQRYVGEPGQGRLVPDIHIWVDWKQVARELAPRVAIDRHSVRHWRLVDEEHGGSPFSTSEREHRWPEQAIERCRYWQAVVGRPTRIEVWDQTWWSTKAEWRKTALVGEPA